MRHLPTPVARIPTLLLALALAAAGCSTGDGGTTTSRTGGAEVEAQGAAPAETGPRADAVTVVGEGTASGRPDVLRAVVGVEVTAEEVQPALTTANERAAAVVEALEEAGVASEDIQTLDVSVRTQHHAPPGPGPEPGGPPAAGAAPIVAVNTVEVRIDDVDRAGEVLQAAADAGGDEARIRSVRFQLDDDDAHREAAREDAFADARRKAEHYAELAGRSLGPLVALEEQPSVGPPPPVPAAEAGGDAAVPIEPGSQTLRVRVTAVWALD